MPYQKDGWTLYTRDVKLKGGKTVTVYFFSARVPKSGTPCDLPEGYTVGLNNRTGIFYLKKR